VFLPLYLQLVDGASPTSSGLRTVPLMLGLLSTAVLSGRAISRLGRYKAFPIAGTAIATVGMYLLSRLAVGTPSWVASVYMLVLGLGLGLVMQVLVLVVQNDAPASDVGVATATATFFRSVGGSFGVAVFGAIFASRLTGGLRTLPHTAAVHLTGGIHLNPRQVKHLSPNIRTEFLHAFAHAIHGVFLWGTAVTALAFLLTWWLREVPLRTHTYSTAQLASEEAAAGKTGSEALAR
jgi:hypothetical protein